MMIGLDANVLVSYMVQDDAKQAALATRPIEQELSAAEPGFISLLVLAELQGPQTSAMRYSQYIGGARWHRPMLSARRGGVC
jgi:predicted nucleic-acid-binding protein